MGILGWWHFPPNKIGINKYVLGNEDEGVNNMPVEALERTIINGDINVESNASSGEERTIWEERLPQSSL